MAYPRAVTDDTKLNLSGVFVKSSHQQPRPGPEPVRLRIVPRA